MCGFDDQPTTIHDVMGSFTTVFDVPNFRSFAGSVFYNAVLDTRLEYAYWRMAPTMHRCRRYVSPHHVHRPIDPFELFFIDPDRITRFTGREFPVWTNRWEDFGTVVEGDWDRRNYPRIHPSYSGPDPSLYLADQFSETPLHQALERHFREDVPWKETAFIREVMRQANDESSDASVWHHCSTVSEIERHCRDLDRLYEDMRNRGCLSIRELNAREGYRMLFREVMENEILIDISRDGVPLFVGGRHRLSIAKILGLDKIPVAVVVRHPQWVRRRSGRHDSGARYEGAIRLRHELRELCDTPSEPFLRTVRQFLSGK